MHVRRGDDVVVIAGKEKGKRGRVLRLIGSMDRVVVERVNLVKRHTKKSQDNPEGGIVEKEGSLAVSNVLLWCESCGKGVRTRAVEAEGKKKARGCVSCDDVFAAV